MQTNTRPAISSLFRRAISLVAGFDVISRRLDLGEVRKFRHDPSLHLLAAQSGTLRLAGQPRGAVAGVNPASVSRAGGHGVSSFDRPDESGIALDRRPKLRRKSPRPLFVNCTPNDVAVKTLLIFQEFVLVPA